MSDLPLVSCICVTRNRVALLRRAVSCFLRQSYQVGELVVLYEADDLATRAYLANLRAPSIHPVEVVPRPGQMLGALRNMAIESSKGQYIAQWDDDDWHSPTRLAEQMNAITTSDKMGCVLWRWLIFDNAAQTAFVSYGRPWEGSLVADRSAVPKYPNLRQGEDTPVIEQLLQEDKLVLLDRPELYVYVYHGENTWKGKHWEYQFLRAEPMTPERTEEVKLFLRLHEFADGAT